jgi:hypothetical protein
VFKAEEKNMKSLWEKMKGIWWDFEEVDEDDNGKKHLSSSDKLWLLYWNFIICMGAAAFFVPNIPSEQKRRGGCQEGYACFSYINPKRRSLK